MSRRTAMELLTRIEGGGRLYRKGARLTTYIETPDAGRKPVKGDDYAYLMANGYLDSDGKISSWGRTKLQFDREEKARR